MSLRKPSYLSGCYFVCTQQNIVIYLFPPIQAGDELKVNANHAIDLLKRKNAIHVNWLIDFCDLKEMVRWFDIVVHSQIHILQNSLACLNLLLPILSFENKQTIDAECFV